MKTTPTYSVIRKDQGREKEKDGQVRTATEVWSAGIAHEVPSAKAGRKLSVMHVASCLRAHGLNMFVSVAHGCLCSEHSHIWLEDSITSR